MAIRVLEVACIAAPERFLCRLDDRRSGLFGPAHHLVNFGLRRNVMPKRHAGGAWRSKRQARVMRNARARPQRQAQARLQIEEGHRTVLELFADDPFSLKTEPVAIELQRFIEVFNAKGDDSNAWLHDDCPSF